MEMEINFCFQNIKDKNVRKKNVLTGFGKLFSKITSEKIILEHSWRNFLYFTN